MSEKDAYQKKLEAKLDEWRAELQRLKAKAAGAEADVEIELKERLIDLRAKRDHAELRLEKLRNAGEGAWQELKSGIERAVDDFGQAVKRARERFD